MLWNKSKDAEDDFLDEIESDRNISPAPAQATRILVRVTNQFNQYKRGDELIVDDTEFTRALLRNGTYVKMGA